MKRVIIVLIVIASLVAAPAFADTRMSSGSFLKCHADTVQELVRQVRTDPAVAARYSAYFHVSKSEVVSYFGSDLKLVTLKQPIRVQCCNVAPNGKFRQVSKTLSRGTAVFAASDGTPVLWQVCGNPITSKLPHSATKVSSKAKVLKTKSATGGGALVGGAASHSASVIAANVAAANADTPATAPAGTVPVVETKVLAGGPEVSAIEAVVTAPSNVVVADAPLTTLDAPVQMASLPEDMAAVAQPAIAAVPPVAAVAGGMSLGWIGALAGLGGGIAAATMGGHSSVSAPSPKPPVKTVPEPGSLLVLVSGLSAGLASLKLRRQRNC